MIPCIIIDDETPARSIIKEFLNDHKDFYVIGEASNGFDGFKMIQDLKPIVVFLDIQMPKLTGFEMLELLDEKPIILFVTAYDQYAIKAFECNAVDYLLKPFTPNRFSEALIKIRVRIAAAKSDNMQFNALVNSYKSELSCIDRVVVKSGNKIKILPLHQIVCIEAADDYVIIHTGDEQFIKNESLKFYEAKLPEKEFLRVHRSFIISLSYIDSIEPYTKETHLIKMKNGLSVKSSRTGSHLLKAILH
ncbi:MAG TPA: LytTR family transcriptional regulator DNA-binding domain-containing protein [Bacteroidales bacterium]|nr:LytTR family transcriptional regulator DNA-binding domain-containing protein [Bacteroidales bacterium]